MKKAFEGICRIQFNGKDVIYFYEMEKKRKQYALFVNPLTTE